MTNAARQPRDTFDSDREIAAGAHDLGTCCLCDTEHSLGEMFIVFHGKGHVCATCNARIAENTKGLFGVCAEIAREGAGQ